MNGMAGRGEHALSRDINLGPWDSFCVWRLGGLGSIFFLLPWLRMALNRTTAGYFYIDSLLAHGSVFMYTL